ncbi:MAG: PAS domain S-box protein [Planctomycetaceae bacterium]|nr:PAS domain S-box protein [Planctomycetaceae bacterium]
MEYAAAIPQDEIDRVRLEAVELAGIGLCRYSAADGTILHIDQNAMAILDLKGLYAGTGDLLGKRLFDLVDFDEPKALVEGVMQGVRRNEYHIRTQRGRSKWLLADTFMVAEPASLCQAVQLVLRDISDSRNVEELCRRSEQRYRDLVENANSIILRQDAKGYVTFMNRYAQEFFGFARTEILGRHVVGTIIPHRDTAGRDMAALVEDLARHPERHEVCERESICRDGRRVWISWANTPMRKGDGTVGEVLCVGYDVTQRREAETQAQRERQRLFSLLHQLPGYVALLDGQGMLRFCNQAYRTVFHWDGPCPCPASDLPEVEASVCQTKIRDILANARPAQWEWVDAQQRAFHVWGYPFVDSDGTVVALQLGVDISEQRRLQRELGEASQSERRRIGRDLHDTLGQDLTALQLITQALTKKVAAAAPQAVTIAQQTVELARKALERTRCLARGLDPIMITAAELRRGLELLCSEAGGASGIACEFSDTCELPIEDDVAADNLYHIAAEAVSNALKHAKASTISIELASCANELVLTVRDNGVGLSNGTCGTHGMGMRTMNYRSGIIGGDISIVHAPGGGTTVVATVPAWRLVAPPASAAKDR